MKLKSINKSILVSKVVDPGEWRRSGVIIPGYVIPPGLVDNFDWVASKYTRDCLGTQSFIYHILLNSLDDVVQHDEEWVINKECEYDLIEIINPTTIKLPKHIGIIYRPESNPDGGVGGNLAIDFEAPIIKQVEQLYKWENDTATDIIVGHDKIEIYSDNLSKQMIHKFLELI